MPEDPRARAADPCRGQLPHSVAGKTDAGGRHSTRQGVALTTLTPRLHCRGTHHRQEWLTPIHRADPAVIADVRHIGNRTGPYCTFRSSGPVQAHLPEATGNPDLKPQAEPWLPSAA